MRSISTCLVLTLLFWTSAAAQNALEDVPRPEARPDESTPLSGTLRAPAEAEGLSPASVDKANGKDTGAPPLGETSTAAGASRPDAPSPPMTGTQPRPIDPETVPLPEPKPAVPATFDDDAQPTENAPLETDKPTSDEVPAEPPLPKPSEIKLQPISPAASVRAAAAVLAAEACETAIGERGVTFDVGTSLSKGSCGVLRPISLKALSSGVSIRTETRMWCPTADALDRWITQAVLPAARIIYPNRRLTGISRISTYVCRNRGSGERISEHARGSAIDIGAFVFEDGEVPVAEADPETPDGKFLAVVRQGACGPFTTVLGPGSDADHSDHFHFDLAARSNGPYCR